MKNVSEGTQAQIQRVLDQFLQNRSALTEEELAIMARTATARTTKKKDVKIDGSTFKRPAVFTWAALSQTQKVAGTPVMYELRLNDDGTTSCTCGAWRFKKKDQPRTCRHVKSIEADAKDYFKRWKKGEPLPNIAPTKEQLEALGGRGSGDTSTGDDTSIKFGRVIDFE